MCCAPVREEVSPAVEDNTRKLQRNADMQRLKHSCIPLQLSCVVFHCRASTAGLSSSRTGAQHMKAAEECRHAKAQTRNVRRQNANRVGYTLAAAVTVHMHVLEKHDKRLNYRQHMVVPYSQTCCWKTVHKMLAGKSSNTQALCSYVHVLCMCMFM